MSFPSLSLDEWEPTRDTLQLYAQIIGKIRLKLAPRRNHWWHVPFYITTTGLTTSAIPYGDQVVAFDFSFIDHQLEITTSSGQKEIIPLRDGLSVAQFYRAVFDSLDRLGIEVEIVALPFDTISTIPFALDEDHNAYDRDYVYRYWQVLIRAHNILQRFAARYQGKTSPVHLFWHSFDLAVTRFSGRAAPVSPEADPVTQDAYSQEVVSFGFWVGDRKVRAPAFYAYVYPEPDGLTGQPLRPAAASWQPSGSGSLALLMYDDAQDEAEVLDFLQSVYDAGARLAQWDDQTYPYAEI